MDNNQHATIGNPIQWWDGIWVLLLALYMLAGISLTPFHGDEATLIFMSRDYAYQFIDGEVEKLFYSESPSSRHEQTLRLLNGPISKTVYGLAWHLSGFDVSDTNDPWDWGGEWDYNIQAGHMPPSDLLQAARWASTLMMAASMVVFFTIGWHFGGRWVAYGASLYYALAPGLLINGQRAMMESSFALFNLLVVLSAIWLLRNPNWLRALLLGAFGGLALASKHTVAFTLVAMFGMLSLIWVYDCVHGRTSTSWRTRSGLFLFNIGKLVSAGIVVLLVFYVLNPTWWGDPLNRAREVVELREGLLEVQIQNNDSYADFSDKIDGFVRQALIAQPQYYEARSWQYDWIADQIAVYEASPWRGLSIGGTPLGAGLLLVFIVIGGWQTIRKPTRIRWLISSWAVMMLILTLGLTPLEWQRYYLPIYPVIGLLAALGLVTSWQTVRNLITQLHASSPIQTGSRA